jgi:hypothetical protein
MEKLLASKNSPPRLILMDEKKRLSEQIQHSSFML